MNGSQQKGTVIQNLAMLFCTTLTMHTASGPGSGGVHLANPRQKRVQHLEHVMPVTSPYFACHASDIPVFCPH